MDTVVVWFYFVGFSIPLLGSVFVLIRSLWTLLVSKSLAGGRPSLIKAKPFQTLFVALAFSVMILLALLMVVFFANKFVVPRYSPPLLVDLAGIFLLLLYFFGFGVIFYHIAGRKAENSASGSSLSHRLADFVAEWMMGKASDGS